MKGGVLIAIWFALFAVVSHALSAHWTGPLRVIFVWTLLMLCVGVIEMMLFFRHGYLSGKGQSYYAQGKCYWTEDVDWRDMVSTKMYMDIYADYSLCDRRYCEWFDKDTGCRFVLLGEVVHGIFCLALAPFILLSRDERRTYKLALAFAAVQFALIVWYVASIFLEKHFVRNEKFWWPPLLWNLPWFVLPPYMAYHAFANL
jgi:hypothetical protein